MNTGCGHIDAADVPPIIVDKAKKRVEGKKPPATQAKDPFDANILPRKYEAGALWLCQNNTGITHLFIVNRSKRL